MTKQPWEIVEDKTWGSVVDYIEKRMSNNRKNKGKFYGGNEELWNLKKAMSEVDSTIDKVGKTFDSHEHSNFDTQNK